ncbi:hypothetical protein [Luteimonas terricola]|uniref:Uncharacterized protein n=1 Tax=Luteimonas terricola TaxID=645597 RepID=A0ABQ2EKG7_9GAMM|nr:hypothetical protein [Luteimonas terricola]GGK14424.1 hypothetical protein GCM10011394_24580 [Luteimonas terricola]
MYATTGFPHHLHWSSFELADAVPRRLSELYRFDVRLDAPGLACANNGDARRGRTTHHYLPASTLPDMFRID